MRHRIYGKQLNRTSEHRKAMLRNMASGLFEHGEIETSSPKSVTFVNARSSDLCQAWARIGMTSVHLDSV